MSDEQNDIDSAAEAQQQLEESRRHKEQDPDVHFWAVDMVICSHANGPKRQLKTLNWHWTVIQMKIKHCEYCGKDLGGEVDRWHGDPPITCGERECERLGTRLRCRTTRRSSIGFR